MSRLLRSLFTGLVAAGTLSHAAPARADSPAPPFSYKKNAPGDKFAFVMISPLPLDVEVSRWNEETVAGIREIRRVYPRSGMYRNDGSAEPLWTVDWYAFGVELTADGVHLIRHGPLAGLPAERNAALGSVLDQEA